MYRCRFRVKFAVKIHIQREAAGLKQPKILYPTDEQSISPWLSKSKVIKQFIQVPVAYDVNLVDALHDENCQVAIVLVDEKNAKLLNDFLSDEMLETTDFVFLSDGEPNESIDEMMTNGAGYHFREPYDFDAIEDFLQDILDEYQEESTEVENTRTSDLDQFGLLAGSSRTMRQLYRTIRKVARNDINVFIMGESGSGKELVANTVHMFSDFKDGPFVAINCGAISPELVDSELFGHLKGSFTGAVKDHAGVFEQADGGTLFLDEVTEMPIEHQVKLLRVLETGEFRPVGSAKAKTSNVRIIAATNRIPAEAIDEGLFREDLFYRLAQFPVSVPTLRQRRDDITGLAKHFLAYRNASEQSDKQISTSALQKIAEHEWPGNVRELKHAIERAFILADDVINPEHIVIENMEKKPSNDFSVPTGVPLEELEKQAIVGTLEENDGNKTETAEQLGVSVKTLYNKLEKYQQDS